MTKNKSKNPPREPYSLAESLGSLIDALNHRNDLVCVLVTTSFLEDCLKTLLSQFFIVSTTSDLIFDHEQHGVLVDLSSRNKAAYCTGLITSLDFDTLGKISHIRNLFAHNHPERSFGHPLVMNACANLRFKDVPGISINNQVTFGKYEPIKPTDCTILTPICQEEYDHVSGHPKKRFAAVAAMLSLRILDSMLDINRCKEKDHNSQD